MGTQEARIKPAFISYSSGDKDFVSRLIADLRDAGMAVWVDQSGLKPGTRNWEQALREAIRDAGSMVLIASPRSRQSVYVQGELEVAEMYDRQVIPVWAVGEQWVDCVPMALVKAQYIDARGAAYEAAIPELVAALREICAPDERLGSDTLRDFEPRNPYKGLRAFEESDARDFFGREALVCELLERLGERTEQDRLVAVVGPSGSGKSSVVMAGLLPRLRNGSLPGSEGWIYLDRTVPGNHPLENLCVTLANALPQKSHAVIRQDLNDLEGRGLHLLGSQITRGNGRRVVLFIDQFEELFTQTVDEDERRQFISSLVTAVSEPKGPIVVVLTLRADFYDHPMQYPNLFELLKAHQTVTPMGLDDLRAVITRPASSPDVQLEFDGSLVGDLIFEVREQAGGLPLLQFTLDQLFRRRQGRLLTVAAYQEIGGLRGALAKHAEETYQSLRTDQHRKLARTLLLRLIEPGATGQDATRRRASTIEMELPDRKESLILREVADEFIKARMLTASEVAGHGSIEVSHEALLREWERLGTWISEARGDVIIQKNLSEDAATWVARGRKPDDDRLYRGTVLQEHLLWMARNVPSKNEKAFIEAGVALQERLAEQERNRRARETNRFRMLVALTSFLVVTLALTVLAARQAALADRRAQDNRSLALALDARQALNDGNPDLALALALKAIDVVDRPLAETERTLAEVAYFPGPVKRFLAHDGPVYGAAISPDGRAVLSGADDSTMILWDIDTATVARRFGPDNPDTVEIEGHTQRVWSVAFSPDGGRALSASSDGSVILWNLETGEVVRRFGPDDPGTPDDEGHTDIVFSVAFSPDGTHVLSSSQDRTVRLWDINSGQEVQRFTGHEDRVFDASFAPDGQGVVSGSADATVRVWAVDSGEERCRLGPDNLDTMEKEGHSDKVYSVSFSPDGRSILSAADDATIWLWDAQTCEAIRTIEGHTAEIKSAVFSADGRRILSGSEDNTVRLWDVKTGQEVRHFAGHTATVNSVALSPDGRAAVSASFDMSLIRWNIATSSQFTWFEGHTDAIRGVAISPDGKSVLTGSEDETARLWNSETGEEVRRFEGHEDKIWSVAFGPDGERVLTGSEDQTVRMWDVETGEELLRFGPDNPETQEIEGHSDLVSSVAFSPDGNMVLSGSHDKTIILWDAGTGQIVRRFEGHSSSVRDVAFSPDGNTIVSSSKDKTIRLWDVDTGQEIGRLIGHTDDVRSVAFSPDGKWIVSGSSDQTARIWRVDTGQEIGRFEGFADEVTSVAFGPDGSSIATGASDRDSMVRVWDVETGKETRRFIGHLDGVTSIVFSPDGTRILSGSGDSSARLWRVHSLKELIEWANANRYVRPLSCTELTQSGVRRSCNSGS